MARLNMMKMVGLILLLVIALTLPTVLPKTGHAAGGQIPPQPPYNRSYV